jgi:hypothetical protein
VGALATFFGCGVTAAGGSGSTSLADASRRRASVEDGRQAGDKVVSVSFPPEDGPASRMEGRLATKLWSVSL